MNLVRRWRHDRKGATAIEYGMLAAMVALMALGGFSSLFNAVKSLYDNNSNRVIERLRE